VELKPFLLVHKTIGREGGEGEEETEGREKEGKRSKE
jgi:hypothetical protein